VLPKYPSGQVRLISSAYDTNQRTLLVWTLLAVFTLHLLMSFCQLMLPSKPAHKEDNQIKGLYGSPVERESKCDAYMIVR
jgi:hypothetical protein